MSRVYKIVPKCLNGDEEIFNVYSKDGWFFWVKFINWDEEGSRGTYGFTYPEAVQRIKDDVLYQRDALQRRSEEKAHTVRSEAWRKAKRVEYVYPDDPRVA